MATKNRYKLMYKHNFSQYDFWSINSKLYRADSWQEANSLFLEDWRMREGKPKEEWREVKVISEKPSRDDRDAGITKATVTGPEGTHRMHVVAQFVESSDRHAPRSLEFPPQPPPGIPL